MSSDSPEKKEREKRESKDKGNNGKNKKTKQKKTNINRNKKGRRNKKTTKETGGVRQKKGQKKKVNYLLGTGLLTRGGMGLLTRGGTGLLTRDRIRSHSSWSVGLGKPVSWEEAEKNKEGKIEEGKGKVVENKDNQNGKEKLRNYTN